MPARVVEPVRECRSTKPSQCTGNGYRRAIKPDLLAPGGRVAVRERPGAFDSAELELYRGGLEPGQRVACPGAIEGARDQTRYIVGTSNATAIATRCAAMLYEVVEELRQGPGGSALDAVPSAVVIKALLAHSADWQSAAGALQAVL